MSVLTHEEFRFLKSVLEPVLKHVGLLGHLPVIGIEEALVWQVVGKREAALPARHHVVACMEGVARGSDEALLVDQARLAAAADRTPSVHESPRQELLRR